MAKAKTKTKTKKKTEAKPKAKAKPKKKAEKKVKKLPSAKALKGKEKEVKEKKEIKKAKVKKEKKTEPVVKIPKYYEAVGRRKTAVARVRIWTKGEKELLINQKSLKAYFTVLELQGVVLASLEKMKCLDKFKVSVVVKGGGLSSQAEAVRHGIARALVLFNPDFRKRLKKAGFLKRDSRMRERKKFGLKRARRAPQWKKR